MPFLQLKLSKTLTTEEKNDLYDEVNELVKLIPGKVQYESMIIINDGCFIKFKEPCLDPVLYLEMHMMGTCPREAKESFVKSVSTMIEEKFHINQDRIAVNIIEKHAWGINGKYLCVYSSTDSSRYYGSEKLY